MSSLKKTDPDEPDLYGSPCEYETVPVELEELKIEVESQYFKEAPGLPALGDGLNWSYHPSFGYRLELDIKMIHAIAKDHLVEQLRDFAPQMLEKITRGNVRDWVSEAIEHKTKALTARMQSMIDRFIARDMEKAVTSAVDKVVDKMTDPSKW